MTIDRKQIVADYGASDVTVNDDMLPWMRSNHAGETGAVWIYNGARCAFWNPRIREMATEHGNNERRHLIVMERLLAPQQRSRLLFLWRISGFVLGLLPAVFGYRAFCITIEAVETFVEQHYLEQIHYLDTNRINSALQSVLQRCCDEEIEHQADAASRHGIQEVSWLSRGWRRIVGSGSHLAVQLAKAI